MSEFCPLCLSKGQKTVLKYFQINLSETTRMCADAKCPYPFGLAYTDTFIHQNVMDMVKDDSIKLGVESLQESVPFQPLHEMNTTKTEPVKGVNLPRTSQSLMPQENENIFELMDLTESDGFSNENVEGMDFNSAAEFESLFQSLVEEIGLGNSQKVLSGQDTGLSVASDSNLNTGLTTDSDMRLNNGLPTDSDSNLNTGLTTDSNSNPNTGLTTDSDMTLNTGLSVTSDLNLNTGLTTDSDMRLNTGLAAASGSNLNTGLTTDSDMTLHTRLSAASDLNLNTGLTTDSDMRLNTGLSVDSDFQLNTGLPTDSDVRINTGLSVDSDLKLNTHLPTDGDVRLNSASSVDSDMKVNTGLLKESDLKKLNTELSADNNKLKTLNTGSSADSFSSGVEGRTVKDVEMEVQLKPLFANNEEKNDNIVAVTESCAKYAESSSSSKVTAGKYEVAPTSNQSQELSITSLYDVSKHIGSTAAGQSLLTRSPVPAAVTVQALDILQDPVGFETVATSANDDPGTGDGEMIISVQSATKGKIEINSCDIMACDSTSAEKSFGVLSAEILHSVTNSDNILTENRTNVISAEVGTPKVTAYTAIDRGEHSCTNIRDQDALSTSSELLNVGEMPCSVRAADKVVTEKKWSDGVGEVDTPLSIACTVRGLLDHSYFKVRDENGTAVTKHSFVSENSVPVMGNIENTIQPLSVPDTGSLTVDVLSVALDDVHVVENVTVSLCDNASMSSGPEIKETTVTGLNLETNLSTAKNMFPKMNSIADTRQQNLTTHAGIEVTVTDSGQAMASGVPIMLEKLMSKGKSHTLQTNCVPDTASATANTSVEQCTDTTVFGMDILERLSATTKARHIVTSRSNYMGMNCSQSPVVSSGLQQKETGNRAHLQKPELCSQNREQCVGMNINCTLDLDDHQYSCSTYVKNGGCLTNSQRPSEAEVKNGLIAQGQNHAAPQTVRLGCGLNSCVVTCRDNVPLSDVSKLWGQVVSATNMNPRVLPTYLPHQQNLNSVQPLSSDSAAAVSQKGAKHHMTAPKAKQNKTHGICTSSQPLLSKPNDAKLCYTQQSKLNTKEANIKNIRSCLKSHIVFPDSNRGKFSGFIFEKPSIPEGNVIQGSKKKKISKTERLQKGRKTHSEQNKLLLTLTNSPHPDRSNCNSSSTDSSNRVTLLANYGSIDDIKVENTNAADHACVENKSDNGSLDWLQQLLM